MKRFRIFFFTLVFALPLRLTAEVSAEDAAPVPSQKTPPPAATRSVVKGDTLWQITRAAYGDSFLWPMLWEANKTLVANPHLIYPGQILALPSAEDLKKIKLSAAPPAAAVPAKDVAAPAPDNGGASPSESVSDDTYAAEEAKAVAPAETAGELKAVAPAETAGESAASVDDAPPAAAQDEAVAPSAPVAVASSAESVLKTPDVKGQPRREARVVDSSFAPDGIVSGIMGERLLVSQGDIVYVHFAFLKPEAGERFGIYRKMGRIRNPSDGKNLGEEIGRIGTLEIIELSADGAASARVVSSRDSVLIKDWVLAEK